MEGKGSHTIVLLQPQSSPASRTYSDFESISKAMDGICQLYEAKLKKMNPNDAEITYDVTALFQFIDDLFDLTALVLDRVTHTYSPHNKKWIKEQVFQNLKRQAGRK